MGRKNGKRNMDQFHQDTERAGCSSCPTKKGRKEKSKETIKADTEEDQEKKSGMAKVLSVSFDQEETLKSTNS